MLWERLYLDFNLAFKSLGSVFYPLSCWSPKILIARRCFCSWKLGGDGALGNRGWILLFRVNWMVCGGLEKNRIFISSCSRSMWLGLNKGLGCPCWFLYREYCACKKQSTSQLFLITDVACQEEKPHVWPEPSHISEVSEILYFCQTDPQSLFITLKLWHALMTTEPKAMLSSGDETTWSTSPIYMIVCICFLIGIYYYMLPLFPLINEYVAAKVEGREESESNLPSCPTQGRWCSA